MISIFIMCPKETATCLAVLLCVLVYRGLVETYASIRPDDGWGSCVSVSEERHWFYFPSIHTSQLEAAAKTTQSCCCTYAI